MKVALLKPLLEKRVSFEWRFNAHVPAQPGCYALSNIYGEILYIGKSRDLCRRMKDHLNSPRMLKVTPLGKACWFNYRLVQREWCYHTEQSLRAQHRWTEGVLPFLDRMPFL